MTYPFTDQVVEHTIAPKQNALNQTKYACLLACALDQLESLIDYARTFRNRGRPAHYCYLAHP